MSRSNNLPKKQRVLEYWAPILISKYGWDVFDYVYEGLGIKDGGDVCFACHCTAKTQRAHIMARCDGGTDEVDNIHLLCPSCHAESEGIDGDLYFDWLINYDRNNSPLFKKRIRLVNMYIEKYKNGDSDKIPDSILAALKYATGEISLDDYVKSGMMPDYIFSCR